MAKCWVNKDSGASVAQPAFAVDLADLVANATIPG
jgi:hypothetical protein